MNRLGLWAASLVFVVTFSITSLAQSTVAEYCGFSPFARGVAEDALRTTKGVGQAPRNGFRVHNLLWELPIGATTGLLIAKYDVPAANRIQSTSLQNTAGRWGNIGVGMELGSAALAFAWGCKSHNNHLSTAGFKMLDAAGAAILVDEGLKFAFNRQYPYAEHNKGEFWEGGKSFPSGHSAVSFAFASALAHEYPHNRWLKWGGYALAAGVSLSRLPAKKHFPSDVLVGGTVGYLVGTYLSSPPASQYVP